MKSIASGALIALTVSACVSERPNFGSSDAATGFVDVESEIAEAGSITADGGANSGTADGTIDRGNIDVTLAADAQTSNVSTSADASVAEGENTKTPSSEASVSDDDWVDASEPTDESTADADVGTDEVGSSTESVTEEAGGPVCTPIQCPPETECRKYSSVDDVCAETADAGCEFINVPAETPCEDGQGECDGDGECIVPGLAQLGSPCRENAECGSSHCASDTTGNQVCCDAACEDACTACSPEGHCDAFPEEDADCGPLECGQTTTCIAYPPPLEAAQCASFGQCATAESYCVPDLTPAGEECGEGLVCDGEGSCIVDCPNTRGPERQCSSDCPCDVAEGVCTSNDDCVEGLVCTPDAIAKLGFPSSSCLPAHCVNDQMDAQETSVDCGDGCGCRATYEVVTISGVPADAHFSELSAMSGTGNAFAGTIGRDEGRFGAPYAARIDASGVVTELPNLGASGQGRAINQDGSVIVGELWCENPPTCDSTTSRAFRWVGDADPTPVFSTGSAYATSASGAISAGTQYNPDTGETTAFRASSTSYIDIPELNTVTAISRDGEFIVGRSSFAEEGAVWSFTEQGTIELNPPSEWTSWGITVLNDDGSVFAGGAYAGSTNVSYIWRNGEFSELPMLPGADYNYVNGMNSDGTVAAGLSGTNSVQRAFLWDESKGIRTVLAEVEERGLELPADLELITVDFLSDDGRILVGWVFRADPPAFWRVTLLD